MAQSTLGQKIAYCRKQLDLSQEALAEKLLVSRQAISKWESDTSIPDVDKLINLGKLFGVSVGWLLGVEPEPTAAYSEEQLKMLEELVGKYYAPRKKPVWKTAFVSCLAIICSLFLVIIAIQLCISNRDMQAQIFALNNDNTSLNDQISEMNKLLQDQVKNKHLLSKVWIMDVFADPQLENVTTCLYLVPKVYQENNVAYLIIENPNTGYSQRVDCSWNDRLRAYVVQYTIPIADGYKYSLYIVNDYGYKEENLSSYDDGFAYVKAYTNFHISPDDDRYMQLKNDEATAIGSAETQYSFNLPVYTPHIFAKTAIAYKDIRITLYLNGAEIWSKSYKDEFRQAAKGLSVNAGDTPVFPNISVTLPQLNNGDELRLILTAETVNGGEQTQSYETLLDYLRVTSE